MGLWRWNSRSRRYQLTADGAQALGKPRGSFVSQKQMVLMRDVLIDDNKTATNGLAASVADGDITLSRWVIDMREEIKQAFIQEYMLGRGGRNAMTQADWGRLGQMIKKQYGFLDSFAADIGAGRYGESGIAARARMYVEASGQAYERANVLSRGMPDLPQYPGDGNQICLSNCKCKWVIKDREDAWECTWTLSPVESCETCLANAARWNPLVIPKQQAGISQLLGAA